MGESGNLRGDVTDGPKGCACSQQEASEGVDRLLRAVFSMPPLPSSPLLRQRLRQRIAHEDSLWRPLDHFGRSRAEGAAKFFTLPPRRCCYHGTVSEFPSELRREWS
jgi:hypothetical protein